MARFQLLGAGSGVNPDFAGVIVFTHVPAVCTLGSAEAPGAEADNPREVSMQWKRGGGKCANRSCGELGIVSVMLTLSTSGGRTARKQATSGSVRLCQVCLDQLAGGELPASLLGGIKSAIRRVTSGGDSV